MIRNFTEHSANKRTFLAWLRTGIAVIGFGFVVEKFNLFILALTNTEAVNRAVRTDRLAGPLGRYEGLALMGVGIVLIVVAAAEAMAAEDARRTSEAKAAEDARRVTDAKVPKNARRAAEAKETGSVVKTRAGVGRSGAKAKATEEARRAAEAKAAEAPHR